MVYVVHFVPSLPSLPSLRPFRRPSPRPFRRPSLRPFRRPSRFIGGGVWGRLRLHLEGVFWPQARQ